MEFLLDKIIIMYNKLARSVKYKFLSLFNITNQQPAIGPGKNVVFFLSSNSAFFNLLTKS